MITKTKEHIWETPTTMKLWFQMSEKLVLTVWTLVLACIHYNWINQLLRIQKTFHFLHESKLRCFQITHTAKAQPVPFNSGDSPDKLALSEPEQVNTIYSGQSLQPRSDPTSKKSHLWMHTEQNGKKSNKSIPIWNHQMKLRWATVVYCLLLVLSGPLEWWSRSKSKPNRLSSSSLDQTV